MSSVISQEYVECVSHFVQLIHSKKTDAEKRGNHVDFLFRGQGNLDWKLEPGLARCEPRTESIKPERRLKHFERLVVEEFIRTYPQYSNQLLNDDWEVLSFAQQHGLPTRLLDWTYNALAALWFAIESTQEYASKCIKEPKGKKDAAVWIFEPKLQDYLRIKRYSTPSEIDDILILRPRFNDPRIVAQSSCYSVHPFNKSGCLISLDDHPIHRKKLTKLIIPVAIHYEIRQDLKMLGIHQATLFPDTDNLCQHLKWRYFKRLSPSLSS